MSRDQQDDTTPVPPEHGESVTTHDVTELLIAWNQGDAEALDRLMPVVYEDLRRIAGAKMRDERAGHTLQATALVHQAYLRLVDQRRVRFESRAHFVAVAATMMRRILVSHARERHAAKRGGDAILLGLDEALTEAASQDVDLVALDDALDALANLSPRQAKIIELRFFGGLTIAEVAEALSLSPATIKLDWAMARAWLFRQLKGEDARGAVD